MDGWGGKRKKLSLPIAHRQTNGPEHSFLDMNGVGGDAKALCGVVIVFDFVGMGVWLCCCDNCFTQHTPPPISHIYGSKMKALACRGGYAEGFDLSGLGYDLVLCLCAGQLLA